MIAVQHTNPSWKRSLREQARELVCSYQFDPGTTTAAKGGKKV